MPPAASHLETDVFILLLRIAPGMTLRVTSSAGNRFPWR
jgi:hypothetical protein